MRAPVDVKWRARRTTIHPVVRGITREGRREWDSNPRELAP
jgi:hypothetical protein